MTYYAVQRDGPRMIMSDLIGWEFSCSDCGTTSRHDHRIDAEDEMDIHKCEDIA